MSDQTVTLRITATAAGLGPATKAATEQVDKVGESASQANSRLQGMGRSGTEAGDQVARGGKRGAEGLRETVKEAAQAQLSIKSVVQNAAQLAGIAIGANLVRGAIQLADGYTNLSSRLRNVAEDESALARVREAAFRIAQDTRQELIATGDLYTSLTRSTEALGLAESQRLRITETINKSFVISGASAEAASNAITQLSQGLASGALRGDEFNSVAEQAPILMDLLARSLGRTRGELREMAAEGLITAEVLATALLQGSAEVDRQFANMALTVSGSITQLSNALQLWVGSSSEGIGASALLAESISLVARNLDPLANLVVSLALAWSAKYVVGLVAAKAASVAKVQANVQLAASELALAQASEAAAAAQVRQAVTLNGTRVATEALAIAQARTAASTAALNAAQAANVGIMSRAGAGLLALAGGPWGVAALAIGGVAVATYNAIEAEKERVREFEAGVQATHAAADAAERYVEKLSSIEGGGSLGDRLQREAEQLSLLAERQDELTAARKRYNEELELVKFILAGSGALGDIQQQALDSGDVKEAAAEVLALELAIKRLSEGTTELVTINQGALAPAIDVVIAKYRELNEAGQDQSFADGLWNALNALSAGVPVIKEMDAAYRDAESIATSLEATAKKASEELQTLGMSAAEVAAAQVSAFEEAARADGVRSEEQIAARKAELEGYAAIVAALEREKDALKARAQVQTQAQRAQRDQLRDWNQSLRAAQTFRDRLEDLRAEMGGPLQQAQREHAKELERWAELARLAGSSAEELAEAQGRLNAQFDAEVIKIAKDAAAAMKDSAKEIGQSWKDVLNGLEDTPLDRLIQDIQRVGRELETATDPATVDRLTRAMGVLQGQLGEVRQSMAVAMITTTQDGLRSLQSMTENGSKAFAAFQVAIDALSVAQAISAVLNQGQGDPYTAFARMAAMAAAVAALVGNIGANFGGSNGFTDTAAARQQRQGTGTVLGDADAKSQSIQAALDIIADATSQLPALSRGMLRALQQLQSGIDSAGGMLARGAGQADFTAVPGRFDVGGAFLGGFFGSLATRALDPLGILGGSSRITDQGIAIGGGGLGDLNVQAYQEQQYRRWRFGSRRTREELQPVGEEFAAQFQLIVDSITEAVRQGALALGLLPEEIEEALAAFRLEEIRISLKDLSAEEQQAELLAVFSTIFDGLAGDVVPFISQFQRLGEGLGETLVRVATGVQVTREALDRLGFSLDAVGPEQFAQISESLIEMVGGIEEFISGMSGFIEAFAPEARKLELLQSDLTRAFTEAGLVLPTTREGMWALMQSLDATTESGREQIATLLRLSGTADAYYTMVERREDEQTQALEAQLQAVADYRAMVEGLRSELDDVGMSDFAREMRDIDRWSAEAREALHEAARAAGMQAAAEEDLALVHQIASQRAAAAIERLRSSAADLVAQLFGTPLDQIESQIQQIEAAQQASTSSQVNAIEQVGAAATRVYEAQLAALQGIQAWLDSQQLGDLSTLTPAEKLAEAQRQFEATLLAAQAGDVDALQAITGQADSLLRLGRDYYASSEPFGDLEARVRAGLRGLVNAGPLAAPSDSTGGATGGGYSGGGSIVVSSELQALYDKRDELLNQQMVRQREAMMRELGMMVRELITATEDPLSEVAESIGLNLTTLAEQLGINLQEVSLETATGLADLARQLGVDVSELAANVGVELGTLADRQSLLNQALDRTLEGIPEEFRNQLRGPLDAIRTATTEADATAAVTAAETAILGMPAGIRNLLAPFFEGIKPPPVITELTRLGDIATTAASQLIELGAIRTAVEALGSIPSTGEVMPSYDVGTAFVPRTGPALIHAGEMIVPASVNAWAQRNGMTIGPAQSGNTDAVVAELRALREQQDRAAQETARRLERLEQAQREGSSEVSREQRRTADLIQQRGR